MKIRGGVQLSALARALREGIVFEPLAEGSTQNVVQSSTQNSAQNTVQNTTESNKTQSSPLSSHSPSSSLSANEHNSTVIPDLVVIAMQEMETPMAGVLIGSTRQRRVWERRWLRALNLAFFSNTFLSDSIKTTPTQTAEEQQGNKGTVEQSNEKSMEHTENNSLSEEKAINENKTEEKKESTDQYEIAEKETREKDKELEIEQEQETKTEKSEPAERIPVKKSAANEDDSEDDSSEDVDAHSTVQALPSEDRPDILADYAFDPHDRFHVVASKQHGQRFIAVFVRQWLVEQRARVKISDYFPSKHLPRPLSQTGTTN